MSVGRRTGAVALGPLVALATLFGVACLCTQAAATSPEIAAVASVAYDMPDDYVREHACVSSGHDQCRAEFAVGTPTTGPGPHLQPLVLPVRVDVRPAVEAFTAITLNTAGPRAPDLHVLQVLRT